MNQLSERYLEDFAVGQTFGSGRLRIDVTGPSHSLPPRRQAVVSEDTAIPASYRSKDAIDFYSNRSAMARGGRIR